MTPFAAKLLHMNTAKVFFPHLVPWFTQLRPGLSPFFSITLHLSNSSRPSHQSDTAGRVLRTFNCIVKSTATFLFFRKK